MSETRDIIEDNFEMIMFNTFMSNLVLTHVENKIIEMFHLRQSGEHDVLDELVCLEAYKKILCPFFSKGQVMEHVTEIHRLLLKEICPDKKQVGILDNEETNNDI